MSNINDLAKRFLVGVLGGSLSIPAAPNNFSVQDYTQAGVIPINTVLLTVDCAQASSVSIQCVSMGTTGVVTPEWSMNGSTGWTAASIMAPAGVAAATFNAAGLWNSLCFARYLRLRLSTATTAGTTTIAVSRNSAVIGVPTSQPVVINSNAAVNVAQFAGVAPAAEDAAAGTTGLLTSGVVRTVRAPATIVNGNAVRSTMTIEGSTTVQAGLPVFLLDVASAARTTSGTSGIISTASGGSIAATLTVPTVSGTNPTLDVIYEESYDNGTSWNVVYCFPRVTAAATIHMPPMFATGLRRWSWVIGGTASPSFTFTVSSVVTTTSAPIVRRLFDRTANVLNGTLNTGSQSINVAGCTNIVGFTRATSAGAYATYQLQVSMDNSDFVGVGSAVAATSALVLLPAPAGTVANFARVFVTIGGTTQVGSYVGVAAN